MPGNDLTHFILLPKLKLAKFEYSHASKQVTFNCLTESLKDFCPHCGMETSKVHDRRWVSIKDATHGQKQKILRILKKRFRCEGMGCKKVFTESVQGISKRTRLTERMQKEILYLSERFANLKQVSHHTSVGNKTIYKRHYAQLDLEWRKVKNNPWPTTIGIYEHSFIRNKKYGHREFVTMVVDYNNKRLKEVLPTRTVGEL